ncbi:MAG: hypothetical protein ABFR05_08845, partial [Bacteroidota bacterium]
RIWLNMHDENEMANNILIGFFKESTDGIDPYYDSFYVNKSKDLNFYSVLDQRELVIQGLGIFSEDKTIALGFNSKKAANLSISISKTEGALSEANIYLVDNLLGITHDLKSGDYQFEQTEEGEFKDRFTLQFATTALGIDDFALENDFNIANTYEGFSIHASKTVAKIKVYDMLGRLLVQETPNKQSFNLKMENIKQGTVLIFESTLENGAVLNKKAIKY